MTPNRPQEERKDGESKDDVDELRVLKRLRRSDTYNSLVKRNSPTEGEQQHGDHKAPEVQLASVTEWMDTICGLLRAMHPV